MVNNTGPVSGVDSDRHTLVRNPLSALLYIFITNTDI